MSASSSASFIVVTSGSFLSISSAGGQSRRTMRISYTNMNMRTDCSARSPLPPVFCSSMSLSVSNSKRGLGRRQSNTKNNEDYTARKKVNTPRRPERNQKQDVIDIRKPYSRSDAINKVQELNYGNDRKSGSSSKDLQFEERLQAIKRSALAQKKFDETKENGSIDYDQPDEMGPMTIGLGTKIGIGVAVVTFGLVFALGDFLPQSSDDVLSEEATVDNKISAEEKKTLQIRLQQFEAAITSFPSDSTSVEGAAVTLAELGEYSRAAPFLEDLTKMKPNDADVFRLLGEVRYQLKDYEGSAAAYKKSAMVSKAINFEVLRGLTNALIAAKKPDEAVQVLLVSRQQLNTKRTASGSTLGAESDVVDPIQVELLLGKAYSDWGHVSDAVSVYDQLISAHPNDFRGYLAKGIVLKENGRAGDAERMFIQARFFAPEKAKALVDRYSRK